MKPEEDKIGSLFKRSLPSKEAVENAGREVLQRLLAARTEIPEGHLFHGGAADPISKRRSPFRIAIAAAVAACFVPLVLINSGLFKKGESLGVIEGLGKEIRTDESVQSNTPDGLTVSLIDGSRVEMRSQSILRLARAHDGLQLQLNNGSIIITAAKQGVGHLYVQTKDAVVSVVGTVFVVSTGQAGSLIGVIEGIVDVQQGGTSTKLLTGQQMTTGPNVQPIPIETQIAWSRQTAAHLALLQQFKASAQHTASQSPPAATQLTVSAPLQKENGQRRSFEVVSIRSGDAAPDRSGRGGALPSGFGCGGSFFQLDPGRFAVSTNVLTLVAMAYGKDCVMMRERNLLDGGPSWTTSEQFTIQATIPASSPSYTQRQLVLGHAPEVQAMLQTLLADRFKLVLRREMKEQAIFALTVNKGGPKLAPFQEGGCNDTAPFAPGPPNPGQLRRCFEGFGVNRQPHFYVTATGATLDRFAELLSGALDRPVLNRTGLSGIYDLHLESAIDFTTFCREPPSCNPLLAGATDSPPLIFDAIQQQLGLKLESTKAPVERWIIDHVERPSEN